DGGSPLSSASFKCGRSSVSAYFRTASISIFCSSLGSKEYMRPHSFRSLGNFESSQNGSAENRPAARIGIHQRILGTCRPCPISRKRHYSYLEYREETMLVSPHGQDRLSGRDRHRGKGAGAAIRGRRRLGDTRLALG